MLRGMWSQRSKRHCLAQGPLGGQRTSVHACGCWSLEKNAGPRLVQRGSKEEAGMRGRTGSLGSSPSQSIPAVGGGRATPGGAEARVRVSSQPHQAHDGDLAAGGVGLAVDQHPRCQGSRVVLRPGMANGRNSECWWSRTNQSWGLPWDTGV